MLHFRLTVAQPRAADYGPIPIWERKFHDFSAVDQIEAARKKAGILGEEIIIGNQKYPPAEVACEPAMTLRAKTAADGDWELIYVDQDCFSVFRDQYGRTMFV